MKARLEVEFETTAAKLRPSTSTAPLAPKMELRSTSLKVHKRVSPALLERTTPLFLIIRVVAPVKAGAQFRIAKYLVRLVDRRHLLLGILFVDAMFGCLVGMVLLGGLAVCRFDLFLIGILSHTENLIVVLGLAALQSDLGFSQDRLDFLSLACVLLFGTLEGAYRRFVVFGLELCLTSL